MNEETEITDEIERRPDIELEWGGEEDLPKKKRGCFLPVWLWGCGGGCLLAIVLSIGGGIYCVGKAKAFIDPEVQWPRLQKVLPFEERPDHMQMVYGVQIFGMENYVLMDFERGFTATIYYFDDGDSEDAEEARQAFFDPEIQIGFMGMGEREDEELSTIRIGSRDRTVMRFFQSNAGMAFGNEEFAAASSGPSASVDITSEEDPGLLVVVFMQGGAELPLRDEEIRAFFEGFFVD